MLAISLPPVALTVSKLQFRQWSITSKMGKKLAPTDGSRLTGENRRYSMGQPVLSETQVSKHGGFHTPVFELFMSILNPHQYNFSYIEAFH